MSGTARPQRKSLIQRLRGPAGWVFVAFMAATLVLVAGRAWLPRPLAPVKAKAPARRATSQRRTKRATSPTPAPAPADPPPADAAGMVIVHVAGMVQRPDVYRLRVTDRVVDAVRLAGGARPDADLDAVNLAAHLQDGEQIYVPSKAAVTSGTALVQHPPMGRAPLAGPLAEERRGRGRSGGHSGRTEKLKDPSQGTIDLNSAAAEELVRLPGVGPSTAQKILEFRKANGKFTSLEDVMNVKGIGPAKFAKMKPFLRI